MNDERNLWLVLIGDVETQDAPLAVVFDSDPETGEWELSAPIRQMDSIGGVVIDRTGQQWQFPEGITDNEWRVVPYYYLVGMMQGVDPDTIASREEYGNVITPQPVTGCD